MDNPYYQNGRAYVVEGDSLVIETPDTFPYYVCYRKPTVRCIIAGFDNPYAAIEYTDFIARKWENR